MDTYDDNTIIPDSVPDDDIQSHVAMEQNDLQEAENSLPDADAAGVTSDDSNSDGSYHGVGVGVRESTLSDAEFFSSQQRQKTFDPEACCYEMPRTMNQRKKRKKFAKKVLKIILAAVLVLAMVLVGCGVSVSIVNRHWQAYIQLMQQNFEQQMDVLRQELEEYDYIYYMDASNARRLQRLFGEDAAKCRPLLSHDVADPWYTGDFGLTWDDILEGCNKILEELL